MFKNDGVFFGGGLWNFLAFLDFLLVIFGVPLALWVWRYLEPKRPTQKTKPKQEFGRLGI